MENLKIQYERIVKERKLIIEQINDLANNDMIKKYFDLCNQNKKLTDIENNLYTEIKSKEYETCSHLIIITEKYYDEIEGRSYKFCGCVKCGLNEFVTERDRKYLSLEDKVKYDYFSKHPYLRGLEINVKFDLDLATEIYKKIKEKNPDIDDKTAKKYLKIALDNIKKIEVNEDNVTNILSLKSNLNI